MDEFDLIKAYFLPLAGPNGLGLRDDVASLNLPKGIVSVDSFVEGVHFPVGWAADKIGPRVLRCAVSDIVAKGVPPKHYLVGLSVTKDFSRDFFEKFAQGLQDSQRELDVDLIGGDSTKTDGPTVVSITVLGDAPDGFVPRSGAHPGDDVWVTGTIGDAYLGLIHSEEDPADIWTSAYERPSLPLEFSQHLRAVASASADVSDGLLADLAHIGIASQVGFDLYIDRIPLSEPSEEWIKNSRDRLRLASSGDDYQIVFTAPKTVRDKIAGLRADTQTRVTRIGLCTDRSGVRCLEDGSRELKFKDGGYTHFA